MRETPTIIEKRKAHADWFVVVKIMVREFQIELKFPNRADKVIDAFERRFNLCL